MLKAYYSHKFFKLFLLLTRLFREQVGTSYVVNIRLGYYSTRAAVAFRRTGDLEQTEAFLAKFYRLVDKHAVEEIDAEKVAKAELHYWLVHRYPKRYKEPLTQAVSKAKATLFNVSPQRLEEFSEQYVAATNIRDEATHVNRVEPDWQAMRKHFEKAYISLSRSINS